MSVRYRVGLAGVGLVALILSALAGAQGTAGQGTGTQKPAAGAVVQAIGVKADYERAMGLRDKLQNTIYNVAETPSWIGTTTKFWYRKSVKGGNQFVLADATAATKAPAFDHGKLAAALSAAAQCHRTLPSRCPSRRSRSPTTCRPSTSRLAAVPRGARGGAAEGESAPAPRAAAVALHADRLQCTRRAAPAEGAAGGTGPRRPRRWPCRGRTPPATSRRLVCPRTASRRHSSRTSTSTSVRPPPPPVRRPPRRPRRPRPHPSPLR